jgi:aryl-alcohol dehydrogenase-like predicted oxidoreductase
LHRVSWAEKVGWSKKTVEQTWNVLDQLRAIAKELNVSIAAAALRWVMQRKGVFSTIIGAIQSKYAGR